MKIKEDINLEKLLFEMLKKQYGICNSGFCNKCYENKMGSCGTALTAQEMTVELQKAGYGDIKQAIKDFAQSAKQRIQRNQFPEEEIGVPERDYNSGCYDSILSIDETLEEFLGR